MKIKKEEILSSCIKLEEEGRKFYLEVAGKTKNPAMKSMFESFAEDELKHIEWFKSLSPEVKTSTEAKEGFYKYLKNIFSDIPQNSDLTTSTDDVKAIDIAIGMEKKSQIAYRKWAKDIEDKDCLLYTSPSPRD